MHHPGASCLGLVVLAAALTVAGPRVCAQGCDPTEIAKVYPYDAVTGDRFGEAVAISGRSAVVGAIFDSDNGSQAGSAFVFHYVDGEWLPHPQKLLASDGKPSQRFGRAVDISGDLIIVGANPSTMVSVGAAYIFRRQGRQWVEEAILTPPGGSWNDAFARSVAISGHTAVVGAFARNDVAEDAGAAFVYEYDGAGWPLTTTLYPADLEKEDNFGTDVAIFGDTIVIGSPGHYVPRNRSSGAAYVFEREVAQWFEREMLFAPDLQTGGGGFGETVAIAGDLVLIGAPYDSEVGRGAGAAYIFRRSARGWEPEDKVVAFDPGNSDHFGTAVAVTKDVVLAAPMFDFDGGGSAYLFRFDGLGWTHEAKIIASDGDSGDAFGRALGISNGTAIFGAFGDDDRGEGTGSAYFFELNCGECLDLEVRNLVAGERAEFIIIHGTPGAKAVTLYGTEGGQTGIRNYAEYCATFGIKTSHIKIVGPLNRRFDSAGRIRFRLDIPDTLAGMRIFFQSAEQGTCPDECVSDVVKTFIR